MKYTLKGEWEKPKKKKQEINPLEEENDFLSNENRSLRIKKHDLLIDLFHIQEMNHLLHKTERRQFNFILLLIMVILFELIILIIK
jgi:hypothetical protein